MLSGARGDQTQTRACSGCESAHGRATGHGVVCAPNQLPRAISAGVARDCHQMLLTAWARGGAQRLWRWRWRRGGNCDGYRYSTHAARVHAIVARLQYVRDPIVCTLRLRGHRQPRVLTRVRRPRSQPCCACAFRVRIVRWVFAPHTFLIE